MTELEKELIKRERQRASFNIEELTNILDGGKDMTERRRNYVKLSLDDDKLAVPYVGNMERKEKFVESVQRTFHLLKNFIHKNGWNRSSPEFKFINRGGLAEYILNLHFVAFIPCLYSFGSSKQVKKWAPLAEDLAIIGAYAQTELGHGSNIRELETTITYDVTTQEFIINSPSITAAKWWPGDMGVLANHVLLMSNLFIGGQNLGLHPFIVQIRDLSTHKPLPGIEVGDIGNKMAFDTIDNGYLLFHNFRIPRENMLCKNSEVKADGSYTRHRKSLLAYASMSNLRVDLIQRTILPNLAKACTISTRYAAVRRQGKIDSRGEEVPILDYVAHQYKLIPQIAAVYALHFATEELGRFYKQTINAVESDDYSLISEMHLLSSGMKALVSEEAVRGLEIVRRACGGHGFANSSGLPRLLLSGTAACTYEGDNTVLYLQVAKILLKAASQVGSKSLTGSFSYLEEEDDVTLDRGNCKDLDCIVRTFQKRSRGSLRWLAHKFQDSLSKGSSIGEVSNQLSIELIISAKAHMIQYVMGSFASNCINLQCSDHLRHVLSSLCIVYALHHINENQGDFIKCGAVRQNFCEDLMDAEKELFSSLRPDLISLVDAFDYCDEALQSCIGCYDGEIYQRLFDKAKQSPLNSTELRESVFRIIKPYLMKGKEALEGKMHSKL